MWFEKEEWPVLKEVKEHGSGLRYKGKRRERTEVKERKNREEGRRKKEKGKRKKEKGRK